MPLYDHAAIWKAYEGVVTEIHDATGAFDKDGNKIELDQSKIDAARVELDKLQYRYDRVAGTTKYASFGDQLGMLYDDIVAGKLDTTGTWATHIKAVKDANPKP